MSALGSLEQGARLGRWRLDRVLGEGATARVWAACHADLPRRAAVKVLRGGFVEDAVARLRFVREAEVVAQVRHRGVVPLFDAGIAGDQAYVVMDLIEGESLAARIERDGAMPPRHASFIVRELADALVAVHAQGVLHRDVKPANVILGRVDDGAERPVLVDFGAAHLLRSENSDAPLTLRGELIGTPAYMAPEQIEGVRLDERADVYALGVLLYECLSGRRPFDGTTWQATLLSVTRGRYVPLRSVNPAVPRALDVIVRRAMHFSPAARYASATSLRDALDDYLDASSLRPRVGVSLAAGLFVALVAVGLLARPRVAASPRAMTTVASRHDGRPAPVTALVARRAEAPTIDAPRALVAPLSHDDEHPAAGASVPRRRRVRPPERGTRGALILPHIPVRR